MKSYSNIRFIYDSAEVTKIDPQVILMCDAGDLGPLELDLILQQYKTARVLKDKNAIGILERVLNNIDDNILEELED